MAAEADLTWNGFKDKRWEVHKFGGTSVANADCFRAVAQIVEEQLGINAEEANANGSSSASSDLFLAVVVSAMGGKPKVTDLLLKSVEAAANRDRDATDKALQLTFEKHSACLESLFETEDRERLLSVLSKDLDDIRDILKTVSLMKWQATRISELVSGYGELWSSQILATLLQNRSNQRSQHLQQLSSSSMHPDGQIF